MNFMRKLYDFTTIEEGKENLEKALSIRDSMGGDLYWNICNADCEEIGRKLADMESKEYFKNAIKT